MSLPENETLQSLCVDIIICNIDRFCAAFLSGSNNLKFYLEFIRKLQFSIFKDKQISQP